MSRQKKEKKVLEHGAIDEAAMLAYLNNELDAQEKQQFESLLGKDPFAQEALEGLRASQAKALSERLSSINRKVKERSGEKEKKGLVIHWSNYAWAAVLLGLLIGIGGALVLFMNKEDNIAMNQETAETEQPNLFETKEELKSAQSVTVAADSASIAQTPVKDSISSRLTDNVIVTDMPPVTANEVATTKGKEPTTIIIGDQNASVAGRNAKNISTESVPPSAAMTAPQENRTETKTSVSVPTTQKVVRGAIVERDDADKMTVVSMDEAMKNFNKGNYKEAGEMFDAILQQQPNNADALYFGGMSEYINGNLKRSEKNFDKLLKDGTKYSDGSKWYKANILLQKGKRDEAKKLLDELSQSGGSYKERAIKKKAELEF